VTTYRFQTRLEAIAAGYRRGALSGPHLLEEIDRLMRGIDAAMGCLDPESKSRDERLAWYRLYDAEMGREPREQLGDL
jgi:hypothetical protein